MAEGTYNYVSLAAGDPAPWFVQRSSGNPRYSFDTAGGRYIVLCFYASARDAIAREALAAVARNRKVFDDVNIAFFGVSADPRDEKDGVVHESLPGIRFFWDFDGTICRLYGAAPNDSAPGDLNIPYRRFWLVLDPALHVVKRVAFGENSSGQEGLFAFLAGLPPPDRFMGFALQAPVIMLANVFEPAFCEKLIGLYESHGGRESGFMRDVEGKTVHILDRNHKQRRDHLIEDHQVMAEIRARVERRIVPEIRKVHQYNATRMERYIISCYAAEERGHFRQHRDNTTKGTAHRRFAVSINLNDDFDGGELSFPEYGPRGFKMPVGGAGVFSCSLLHMVSPVTRGKRYALLPFLYDEEAARIRIENNKFLGEEVPAYRDPEIEKKRENISP